MSHLASKFSRRRKTLIGYLTVGYPDPETTLRAARVLGNAGCDIIELGIPFSDPIGDGQVIQTASHRALMNGITPAACLEMAARLRQETDLPLVFMSYYNPVLSYGVGRFCRDCQSAGVNGLIIPDLPPEESGELGAAAAACGVDLVFLLAPTSTADRIAAVCQKSSGFIYLTSVAGITGARDGVPGYLPQFAATVRREARHPLAVGFGISSPAQARAIAEFADGVIIGSRLLQMIEADFSLNRLGEFVSSVRDALDT
ncbi:tryptophan synthase, alpha chain [Dehalogenimonas formicexedens]|uniref:Tryptophan synthase alpha chain n=1 Tax=Dehalogenimonas formicexedens TaxID=1839801 RepID=A0A1P8F5S7_9CHLR|nr:tryptophan synthase subunit alpha [Dehalogenimonas formicexedens]APV43788.1 tryptophan synthase, alpha chain [Dehalogenimonas formicexedens]